MKRHIRKLRNSRFSELFRSFLRDVEARGRRSIYSCGQRAKRTCLHGHLATAARVKYSAALPRCKFDAP